VGQGVQFARGQGPVALLDGAQQVERVRAQREPGAGVVGARVIGLRGPPAGLRARR
jgi:hypothetical protein